MRLAMAAAAAAAVLLLVVSCVQQPPDDADTDKFISGVQTSIDEGGGELTP